MTLPRSDEMRPHWFELGRLPFDEMVRRFNASSHHDDDLTFVSGPKPDTICRIWQSPTSNATEPHA